MKTLKNLLCTLFSLVSLIAYADNERPISAAQLPAAARQFIEQHFPESKIMLAKRESDLMKKSYEVLFDDGCQIEFDGQGAWKEIDCKRTAVPSEAVPEAILDQVRRHYPEVLIVKIERDRRGYEVKLSNRLELTFNRAFDLVDIDD